MGEIEHLTLRFGRLERAFRTIVSCNQLLTLHLPEGELLQRFCDLAITEARYRMAWVGFAETGEARRVLPVAQAGFEEGYLGAACITWLDAPSGRGPVGTAIRTGRDAVFQNLLTNPDFLPWRKGAQERGYASAASFPLKEGEVTFGALTLYADEADAFDRDEVKLLSDLARDLTFGILAARERTRTLQLGEALRRAEHLEAVGRVAASIVHDVNNLLGMVTVTTATTRRLLPHDEALHRDLGDIDEAVQRAAALNRQVLRFAARAPAQPVDFDPDGALEALWPLLVRSIPAEHDARRELAAAPWQLHMDAAAFEQIVTNLVLNARDALSSPGTLTVRTGQRVVDDSGGRAGERVVLSVSDTGVGMAEEVKARAFEPFFTTKGEQGTGLGLASVFGLVRQAGGTVTIESAPGKGTRVEVLLPRAKPPPA